MVSVFVTITGGVVVDVHSSNMSDGIHQMVGLLHDHKVDGFLIDRYALVLFYTFFDNHPMYAHDVAYIRNYCLLTDVTANSRRYMHGILLKQRQHFHFLDNFVQSNREVIDSCNRLFLNAHSRSARLKQPSDPLFSTDGEMFWPTIYSLVTMLVLIIVAGVAYEARKETKCLQKKKTGAVLERHNIFSAKTV